MDTIDSERLQVMVLGTYHLPNPGPDVVQFEVADVITSMERVEIAEVA